MGEESIHLVTRDFNGPIQRDGIQQGQDKADVRGNPP